MRLEGIGKLKNSMSLYGIEPATFRIIPYYLNQLRYRMPHFDVDLRATTPHKTLNGYQILHRVLIKSRC
jgi:hypothetical protein